MHLIQAIYKKDVEAVLEHMKQGRHPVLFIEHCVTSKHRLDLLPFVLGFLSVHDDVERRCVERIKRHLEFIDRYPISLQQINAWLAIQNQS